jgi:hypothetical protein
LLVGRPLRGGLEDGHGNHDGGEHERRADHER